MCSFCVVSFNHSNVWLMLCDISLERINSKITIIYFVWLPSNLKTKQTNSQFCMLTPLSIHIHLSKNKKKEESNLRNDQWWNCLTHSLRKRGLVSVAIIKMLTNVKIFIVEHFTLNRHRIVISRNGLRSQYSAYFRGIFVGLL